MAFWALAGGGFPVEGDIFELFVTAIEYLEVTRAIQVIGFTVHVSLSGRCASEVCQKCALSCLLSLRRRHRAPTRAARSSQAALGGAHEAGTTVST